jgi:SAM-dependent methyltransferase
MSDPNQPKLYEELASWWTLMSPVAHYEEEAAFYGRLLRPADVAEGLRPTLLELGSGGGNNAFYLKRHFLPTLVEPAPGMRAQSSRLNPDCEHFDGDMRSVRLGRTFDAVFIQDAICYMITTEDLEKAVATAWVHCRPGGVALFAPDYVRENFRPGCEDGGEDGDGRGMRYFEWASEAPTDQTFYTVDYAFLLREGGQTRCVHDQHVEGLFPRETWLQILRTAGFEPESVPFEHSELEPSSHEVFVGRRPAE